MQLFVYLNGVRRGPFTDEQVQGFLDAGLLRETDLAGGEEEGDWKPLSTFRRFHDASPALAAPVAPTSALSQSEPPPLAAETLGPYSRSTLAPNETPHFKTTLHWIIFARFAGAGLALFLFAAIPFAIAVQALTGSELGWFVLILPAFLLLAPTLAFASSEFVITNRRVLIKTGIVRRRTAEVFVSKIESISVDQGFLGRMFDFGTVRIRGTGGFEEAFDSIAQPLLFRKWVQRLQDDDHPTPAREATGLSSIASAASR